MNDRERFQSLLAILEPGRLIGTIRWDELEAIMRAKQ